MKNLVDTTTPDTPAFTKPEIDRAYRANREVREFIEATFPKAGEPPRKTGKQGAAIAKTWQEVCDDVNAPLPMFVQNWLNTPDRIAAFITARTAGRRALTATEAKAIANGRDIKGTVSKRKKPAPGVKSRANPRPCMGERDGEPYQIDLHHKASIGAALTDKNLGVTYRKRFPAFAALAQALANAHQCPVRLVFRMYVAERNLRDEVTATKYNMPLSAVGLPSLWNGEFLITNRRDKFFAGQIGDPGAFVPEPDFE
jgi:hypothetical protein